MRLVITAILILMITAMVQAQEKYFYFGLDINKPLVNTTWIGETSAHGFRAGYRGFINPKFSAGLDVGSITLEQYNPIETQQNGNGAITTDYFKYVYSYSAAVSGQYHFQVGDAETFFPYVGLGLGANNNEYVIYYNIYQDSERNWGFLARPEAGILVKIGRGSFGAMAAIHYDYSTNKSEKFNYSNFSTVGVQVGIILIDL
jgi:hypothetical protein